MSLSEILHNPHFQQFAALLSVAMLPEWSATHPEVPYARATIEYRLSRLNRGLLKDADNIKREFVKEWTQLFVQIVESDPRLRYSIEDFQWFTEVLDGEESEARMTFSMLFAVASSQPRSYSADQVAAMSDKAASTWRNLAAGGNVPGAFKAGDGPKAAWLFPEPSLRAMGIQVPDQEAEAQ